ncbi:hypothetical protein LPJ59_001929, partial [Coemansia sp. RSA 2399]
MEPGRHHPQPTGATNKGKSRPQKSQQPTATYPNTPYPETNYTQYTHGSDVNAHLKPVTYDTLSTCSMAAHAGSTASSVHTSGPQKAQGKSSHKHQRQSQPSVYQAFEYSASQQPLTSSVLAVSSATQPAKPRRKKKHHEHHGTTNNSSLIIPVPQRAERAHDVPARQKQHHRHHNGHDIAQQSMSSVVMPGRFQSDPSMVSYPSPMYGQHDARFNATTQGLQSSLRPVGMPPIQQHQPCYILPVLQQSQSQPIHPYYQQQQQPYDPQSPAHYPPPPDHTAIHSASSSLPVIAATYLQQHPPPPPPQLPVVSNSQTYYNTSYSQQPQNTTYMQPMSHSVPVAQSMPHIPSGPGYGYHSRPNYGSQPVLAPGSE